VNPRDLRIPSVNGLAGHGKGVGYSRADLIQRFVTAAPA